MTALLPAGFEALEPFVSRWAGASAAARAAARDVAEPDELNAFYEAVQPMVELGLAYLDGMPLDGFSAAQARLMRLLLGFAHVAMAVEVQRDDEPKHGRLRHHMRILRAPADAPDDRYGTGRD